MAHTLRCQSKSLRFEQLEARVCLSIDVQLIADVNKTAPWEYTIDHKPSGNYVFFMATAFELNKEELWRTDGTNAGTIKLATFDDFDIERKLTDVNGTLFFVGNDSSNGIELWRSDGTVSGTKLVKNQSPGAQDSQLDNFVRRGNILFYTQNGNLMRSNGTLAGTSQVADLLPGSDDSVSELVVVGNSLYFKAKVDASNFGIFKTEGSSTTTVRVNIAKGNFQNLAKIGDSLYFSRLKTPVGAELWKTVGTTTSTQLVAPNISRRADNFTDFNGAPIFEVDGEIQKIAGGQVVSVKKTGTSADNFFSFNNRLFFSADSLSTGNELWTSDGTTTGTFQIKDISPGSTYGEPSSSDPRRFTALNGKLYFIANGESGVELWTTDGTDGGTLRVEANGVFDVTKLNGSLYFNRVKFSNNFESTTNIFVRDPNQNTSRLIVRPQSGTGDANPSEIVVLNGMQYFSADDGINGQQLWKYNPGTGQTSSVTRPGATSFGNVDNLSQANGLLYFTATSATQSGLWKSDGTQAGTTFLAAVSVRKTPGIPTLVNLNGNFYFSGATAASGTELWVTNGTVAGTRLVKDINPFSDYFTGVNSSSPRELTVFNNNLYFTAYTNASGRELWKSDGTVQGTQIVTDLFPGEYYRFPVGPYVPYSSNPRGLTALNGKLVFVAEKPTGTAIWNSDGTAAGTITVQATGANQSTTFTALPAATLRDEVYYALKSADGDTVVWKTDGTAFRTQKVIDVRTSGDSRIRSLINSGGTLYFVADDGVHGEELWESDGTQSGTKLVADIAVGSASSLPHELTSVNDVLFFVANDQVHGIELWRTNGTAEGATLVRDLVPGSVSSNPTNLKAVRGFLSFSAKNALGQESWTASSVAPTFRNIASSVDYNRGDPFAYIAPTATVFDADTLKFFGGKLAVKFNSTSDFPNDRFDILNKGLISRVGNDIFFGTKLIGIVSRPNGGRSLEIELTTNATQSAVSRLIQAIVFRPAQPIIDFQSRPVRFTLTDGEGAGAIFDVQVRINASSATYPLPNLPAAEGETAAFASSETISSLFADTRATLRVSPTDKVAIVKADGINSKQDTSIAKPSASLIPELPTSLFKKLKAIFARASKPLNE